MEGKQRKMGSFSSTLNLQALKSKGIMFQPKGQFQG